MTIAHLIKVVSDILWLSVTKVFLGMQIAVPASMLCFAMDLHYYIIVCESSHQYDRQKWNRKLVQVFICVVVPLLYMALRMFSRLQCKEPFLTVSLQMP